MVFTQPSAEIMFKPIDTKAILKRLETIGRTCYASLDKMTETSASDFVRGLVKRQHEAILEHATITVKFIIDRGISHEIVRHRVASYAQESTRYCNYNKTGDVKFIIPPLTNMYQITQWEQACKASEETYMNLINSGIKAEIARDVLNHSVATTLIVTMNLREWRHFFKLRALGTTGKPHPQMTEVTIPLLKEFQTLLPEVFGDLV